MDSAQLRSLYDGLIALAEEGNFGPPPEGQWRAELLLAHIALTDARICAATELVIAGEPASLDNAGIHEATSAELEAFVALHPTIPELVTHLRVCAERLCGLIEQLTEEQGGTAVPTKFSSDGEVVLDEEMPWAVIVTGACLQHVSGHAEQLKSLQL